MAKDKHKKQRAEGFEDFPLDELAMNLYYIYGVATLEERAIADFRDGFGPVHRRVLTAAYELNLNHKAKAVKSARVVGDTMGKYHPHGDSATYGTMVGLANRWVQMPFIHGDGNWGSLTDPKNAAMRYTEATLTKFADEILFNKFYMPIVEYVPNYDGSMTEPLVLPALLPIILINGHFGIATGATAKIPSFKFKTVLKLLRKVYEGEELTPKLMYHTLQFRSLFGGEEREMTEKEDKSNRMDTFRTRKGKVTLWSNPVYDEKRHTVTVTKFAVTNMEGTLERLNTFPGVQKATDESKKGEKYGTLQVQLKKNLTSKDYSKLVRKIDKELSNSWTWNQNFTERYVDKDGQGVACMRAMPLVEMLAEWVKWRTELERKACTYWIGKDDEEIRKLELLMQAVDLIDTIIKLVKDDKLTEEQVYEKYSKAAKCTVEEAKYVLGRPIISLRKLEKKTLLSKKQDVEKHKSDLEKRRKKPEPYLAQQLEGYVQFVEKE